MYSLDLETQLLRLALERGLLDGASREDLDPAPLGDPLTVGRSSRFGPRVDRLVAKGLLSPALVEALMWEAILGPPAAGPPDSLLLDGPSRDSLLQDLEPVHPPELSERFLDFELVGEGATAKVYKAFDTRLERWVALKFLRTSHAGQRERLLAEARTQARLEHPNICRVYEVGLLGDQGYIVMEYARGATLAQAALNLDEPAKIRIVQEVAEGIHAAHQLGLVHLDLKPGNILLQRQEGGNHRPLVADFGMVRSLEVDGPPQPSPMGTPPFSSPEQIEGRAQVLDRRSDVYSLGVVLYTLLTGTLPFEAADHASLLEAIRLRPPTPLRQRIPKAPEDLQAILDACLAKDPAQRYPTALALAEDLQRYLSGSPIQARPRSWLYQAQRWTARNRKLVAAVLAGVLGILGTASILGYRAWFAQRQGEWAQKLEQEVDHWESFLGRIHALPAHDIRPELAQIEAGLRRMEQEVAQGGRPAQGPGHYALGRMHRLLGRNHAWWLHTGKSWDLGFRTPQCMTNRAQVLLEQYQAFSSMLPLDPRQRQIEEAKLKQRFFDPALGLLMEARTVLQDSQLREAQMLLALIQEDTPKALDLAERHCRERPWDYEALQMKASVLLRAAWNIALKNELVRIRTQVHGVPIKDHSKIPEMTSHLESAIDLMQRALRMAPSDPASYAALAEASRFRTMLFLDKETDQDSINAEIKQILEGGSQIDPQHQALINLDYVFLRASLMPSYWEQGRDPRPLLHKMVELENMHHDSLRRIDFLLGEYDLILTQHVFGEPALESAQKRLRDIERESKSAPLESKELQDLDTATLLLKSVRVPEVARPLWEVGQDPSAALKLASEILRNGPEIVSQFRIPEAQYAVLIFQAEIALGTAGDPDPHLGSAAMALARARTLGSTSTVLPWAECEMARLRASDQTGPEHRMALQDAALGLGNLGRDATLPPLIRYRLFHELGKAHLLLARLALEHSESPEGPLKLAREALEMAWKAFPPSTEIPERLAEWSLLKAKTMPAPKRTLEEGLALTERALRYATPLTQAEIKRGLRRSLPIRGVEWPHQPRTLRYKGEILWELAKLERSPLLRGARLRAAEETFNQSLAGNRHLEPSLLPLLIQVRAAR